jgi:hypothetical protein
MRTLTFTLDAFTHGFRRLTPVPQGVISRGPGASARAAACVYFRRIFGRAPSKSWSTHERAQASDRRGNVVLLTQEQEQHPATRRLYALSTYVANPATGMLERRAA